MAKGYANGPADGPAKIFDKININYAGPKRAGAEMDASLSKGHSGDFDTSSGEVAQEATITVPSQGSEFDITDHIQEAFDNGVSKVTIDLSQTDSDVKAKDLDIPSGCTVQIGDDHRSMTIIPSDLSGERGSSMVSLSTGAVEGFMTSTSVDSEDPIAVRVLNSLEDDAPPVYAYVDAPPGSHSSVEGTSMLWVRGGGDTYVLDNAYCKATEPGLLSTQDNATATVVGDIDDPKRTRVYAMGNSEVMTMDANTGVEASGNATVHAVGVSHVDGAWGRSTVHLYDNATVADAGKDATITSAYPEQTIAEMCPEAASKGARMVQRTKGGEYGDVDIPDLEHRARQSIRKAI